MSDSGSSSAGSHLKGGMPLHTKILIGLVVGAALGLAANAWSRSVLAGAAPADPGIAAGAGKPGGQVAEGFAPLADRNGNGSIDGLDLVVDNGTDFVGKLFLRIIIAVVIPLVVSSLTLGVYGIGDVRKLGRIGLVTLLLTAVLSGCAVVIGVGAVNVFRPGHLLSAEQRERLKTRYSKDAAGTVSKAEQAKPARQILLDMIPENPIQEMVGAVDGSSKGNGMLAVMFFAVILGAAMTVVPDERVRPMVAVLEALFDVTMVVIGTAMRLAPFAVACMTFTLTSRLGFDILRPLAGFAAVTIGGLAMQLLVVYSILVLLVARRSPLKFFRDVQEAMWTAFGTSSSNATLPTALRVAEERLGLRPTISRFVLTVGATGNQNGTALYEGVVVLFLAQVFGVELTLTQQVTVVLMSVLAGIGTAGVPGGSLPMIVIVMKSVGVPGEGIGIILGIDRILDMCRTVLNVTGDLALATCVDALEPAERTERQ
jgi:DAACS family dicarboxylate/amino acid:cation (Na+ or H+) symporter